MTLHAVYRPGSFIGAALVASVLWGLLEALAQVPEPRVASIEIRGAKRIEVPAIAGRLTLKVGDPYRSETVRGQVKILYDTGFLKMFRLKRNLLSRERPSPLWCGRSRLSRRLFSTAMSS